MITTPFDTARLDEECARVAHELSRPEMSWGTWDGCQVKAVLLGQVTNPSEREMIFASAVYRRCRRPKVVPA